MEFVFVYGLVLACILYGLSVAFMAGAFAELKTKAGKYPDMFLVVICALIWPVTILTFSCYWLGVRCQQWWTGEVSDLPRKKIPRGGI